MEFIKELLLEITLILLIGLPWGFVIWKMRRSRLSFGEYFSRYGELLAILGGFVLAVIVALVSFMNG